MPKRMRYPRERVPLSPSLWSGLGNSVDRRRRRRRRREKKRRGWREENNLLRSAIPLIIGAAISSLSKQTIHPSRNGRSSVKNSSIVYAIVSPAYHSLENASIRAFEISSQSSVDNFHYSLASMTTGCHLAPKLLLFSLHSSLRVSPSLPPFFRS